MNYPVWNQALTGGGLLIALIAVVHVYIAHLAVGGGFFLVITEWIGHRRRQPEIVAYVKRHTRFFLLLTMVLGAVTGVGIWFTISVLAPGATSILIHTFVFAWATEWVFFAGEIISLLVYYYRFDQMTPRDHLIVGWFYAAFAWLSLFMINGIIAFMLTPGRWLETGRFWDGFFNPSMWPSLGFRTCIALMVAGIFGVLTAVFAGDRQVRRTLVNGCLLWTVIAFALSCPFLFWYFNALSPQQQAMILTRSPELADAGTFFGLSLAVILIGTGLLATRLRGRAQQAAAILILVAGLGYMGGFEWLREGARRPYLITGHTYANGIPVARQAAINAAGVLKTARWTGHGEITDDNRTAAGRALFRLQCSSCHSIGGPANDILPLTRGYTVFGMDAQLAGQGKLSAYMPPFMGTTDERQTLASYIVGTLQGRKKESAAAPIAPEPVDIPSFDPQSDEYILLAATALGMHEFCGAPGIWSFRTPVRASVRAQLIRRGETPEMVMDGVSISLDIPDGQGDAGPMTFSDTLLAWTAAVTDLSAINHNGDFSPYPLATLTAKQDNRTIATTRITLPQSTEMGCSRCHGGSAQNRLDEQTALNVLRAHDRRSRTRLLRQANNGQTITCTACHRDDDNAAGQPLNLSAAMHAFHAVYLGEQGDAACTACHAADETGATRFFRGIHHEIGLACSNCHGSLTQMAAGLLNDDRQRQKAAAARILPWITQTNTEPAVPGRRPWVNLPDCLGCHVDFMPPDTDELPPGHLSRSDTARFANSADDAGLLCISCHGSPHALCPANTPYGMDRDNLVALQFQGQPYPIGANGGCQVCHTIDMEETIHHFGASAAFRNRR